MKKVLFVLILTMIFVVSPVFAEVSGFDSEISDASTPLTKVIAASRIVAVTFIVIWILWSAIKYLKASAGEKPEILKTAITGTIVASVFILIAFKVPAWLGLKGVVTDNGAVITQAVLEKMSNLVK